MSEERKGEVSSSSLQWDEGNPVERRGRRGITQSQPLLYFCARLQRLVHSRGIFAGISMHNKWPVSHTKGSHLQRDSGPLVRFIFETWVPPLPLSFLSYPFFAIHIYFSLQSTSNPQTYSKTSHTHQYLMLCTLKKCTLQKYIQEQGW